MFAVIGHWKVGFAGSVTQGLFGSFQIPLTPHAKLLNTTFSETRLLPVPVARFTPSPSSLIAVASKP